MDYRIETLHYQDSLHTIASLTTDFAEAISLILIEQQRVVGIKKLGMKGLDFEPTKTKMSRATQSLVQSLQCPARTRKG